MLQIYGLKVCDTCRKAVKALPDATFTDVRVDGISQALLSDALEQFGEKLVNTRSTTWRGLDEKERTDSPLELLQRHPALMKRPLIIADNEMYLGWDVSVRAALNVS